MKEQKITIWRITTLKKRQLLKRYLINQATNQPTNQPTNQFYRKETNISSASQEFSTLHETQRLINFGQDNPSTEAYYETGELIHASQSISLRSILILSSHPSLFYHYNNIWCRAQLMKLLIIKSPQLPIHSLFLVPNIIPSTLFSTHSVLMRGQVLQPCKTVGLKDNIKFNHIKMDLKMQARLNLRSNNEH